jgi:hypothetical protein
VDNYDTVQNGTIVSEAEGLLYSRPLEYWYCMMGWMFKWDKEVKKGASKILKMYERQKDVRET